MVVHSWQISSSLLDNNYLGIYTCWQLLLLFTSPGFWVSSDRWGSLLLMSNLLQTILGLVVPPASQEVQLLRCHYTGSSVTSWLGSSSCSFPLGK